MIKAKIKQWICALLIAIMLIATLAFVGHMGGAGGFFDQKIRGGGSVDVGAWLPGIHERIMGQDLEYFNYQARSQWLNAGEAKNASDPTTTFVSSYIISGAKGTYRDQYSITAKYANFIHTLGAKKISGDFAGDTAIIVSATSGDSIYRMEGDATFSGRVINYVKGKPASSYETDLVGLFSVEQHLNNTIEPLADENDWLKFCDTLDDELKVSGNETLRQLKIEPTTIDKNDPDVKKILAALDEQVELTEKTRAQEISKK